MDCPLYNEDDDAEHAPESVRTLRSTIEASDGVIMISPEYNRGMSSVLKNALAGIDSRPLLGQGQPALVASSVTLWPKNHKGSG